MASAAIFAAFIVLIACFCVSSSAQQVPTYKFDAVQWSPPAKLNNNLKYDAEAIGSSIKCLAGPPPSFFCIKPSVKRDMPVIVRNRQVDRDQCYTCLATQNDVDYKMLFADVERVDYLADYKNSSQLFIRLFNVTNFPTDTSFFDKFDNDLLASVVFTFSNGSEAVYNYISREERLATTTTTTSTTAYPATTRKLTRGGLITVGPTTTLQEKQVYATGAPPHSGGCSSSFSRLSALIVVLCGIVVLILA